MKTWLVMLGMGIVLLIGGIFALANPFAATLAVTTIVGVVFLATGILQAYSVFRDSEAHGRVWHGISALLSILAGVWLLANPLAGTVSLTLIVGVLFLFIGGFRLAAAWGMRSTPFFWILLLSGAASILIGIMVFSNLQMAAFSLLGILLAVELIADGVGLIAIGLFMRSR
ncbi:HdeD family acid-resistance protein [Pseudooceanicola sp. 502str34]|uniref:HdeD family acid-resistance protein n=1 Tax=Maritimibacter alkaliphilus TaxID=404236 RepID=UPI001C966266|nr:DUF308 domain-containing protein [Maritimibacter alkaliphilus]MBY6091342.1 DUF308 domain-containing protein [Maritimibacter alkaliphilus]